MAEVVDMLFRWGSNCPSMLLCSVLPRAYREKRACNAILPVKRKLTSQHKVMADQAEEHCTIPCCTRGSQPRQSKRRKTMTSPLSDTARRSRSVGSDSANDRQQFRFTCVSANTVSDTRHGWQPVSTASCRL